MGAGSSTRPAPGSGAGDAAALPITVLSGVGAVRARRLERLGLLTLGDLLRFAPRRLESHAGRLSIAEARERVGEEVTVAGVLGPYRFYRRGGRRSTLSLGVREGDETIEAFWFGQPWMRERLGELQRAGDPVLVSGRIVRTKKGAAFASPRLRPLAAADREEESARLVPVYALTEGIGQELLRGLIAQALERTGATLPETLPAAELARHGVATLGESVLELHRPTSLESHVRARRRMALEPLVDLAAELLELRAEADRARAHVIELDAGERASLLAELPFAPTGAQARVVDEILDDFARERPMRRLLQGDVGAGKTFVGIAACLAVAERGGQAALLAPTELLAEQHALGLAGQPAGRRLKPVLLTGSLARAERGRALAALASGSSRLAVGTHALLSEDVRFHHLALVVIDEQQRFGVAQRQALLRKRREAHALLMTATPIPRTMALALYGDLELSRLDEKPPGRGPIETHVVRPDQRARVLAAVARRVADGERVFWVCPRIESGAGVDEEDEDVAAAERVFARLSRSPLAPHGVELVHGRIDAAERAQRLGRFRSGASRALVATTVIEVGVDVPEATLMVVQGAERFGLAQLHQLRGRIGRGPERSTCFFVCAPEARERLAVLEREDDGFRIAEVDLEQRGMGDLVGARQSGTNQEGMEDPLVDPELVELARRLVTDHPALARARGRAARGSLDRLI